MVWNQMITQERYTVVNPKFTYLELLSTAEKCVFLSSSGKNYTYISKFFLFHDVRNYTKSRNNWNEYSVREQTIKINVDTKHDLHL